MKARRNVLPGFGISTGITLAYISLLILIPLSAVFLSTATGGWEHFRSAVTSPQVVASYKLTIGASIAGAAINAVFGLLVAWVLARYDFFGKRLVDAIVDLPFALPTAVAGLSLTAIYSENGWFGRYLLTIGNQSGIHAARNSSGVDLCRISIRRAQRSACARRPRHGS